MLKSIIAISRDGTDLQTVMFQFEVPDENFDLMSAIRNAAKDYCNTEDGRDRYEYNNHCFNWGDFDLYVPDEICKKHGFSKIRVSDGDEIVDFDEELVDLAEIASANEQPASMANSENQTTEFRLNNQVSISLGKEHYENLGEEVYVQLIDALINAALQKGYTLTISIWEDDIARDRGTPMRLGLQEYIDSFDVEEDEDVSQGKSLRWSLEESFGNGGCTEILLATPEEESAVYHIERGSEYVLNELFDFLSSCEDRHENNILNGETDNE